MERTQEVLAITYYYIYWLKIRIEDANWRAGGQSWSLDGFCLPGTVWTFQALCCCHYFQPKLMLRCEIVSGIFLLPWGSISCHILKYLNQLPTIENLNISQEKKIWSCIPMCNNWAVQTAATLLRDILLKFSKSPTTPCSSLPKIHAQIVAKGQWPVACLHGCLPYNKKENKVCPVPKILRWEKEN